MAAVALAVKMVVSGSHETSPAALVRAPSNSSVERSASAYTLRCTVPYEPRLKSAIASMTASGFCDVAAESR